MTTPPVGPSSDAFPSAEVPPADRPGPMSGGYPQQPYPQQPYQPSPYLVPPTMDHPQGTTILVLGILSLVAVQILGPVAWIMGSKALAEIDADPTRYRNRGTVQAGRIMGMIATILGAAVIIFFVVIFGALLAAGS